VKDYDGETCGCPPNKLDYEVHTKGTRFGYKCCKDKAIKLGLERMKGQKHPLIRKRETVLY
jgi:hypothetical protein